MKRIALIFLLLCSTALAGYRGGIVKDSEDVSLTIFLRGDDDGQGEASVAFGDVTCYYKRNGVGGNSTSVNIISGTLGSHAEGGWAEDGNVAGLYQFHAPDAAFTAGVESVTFFFSVSGVIDQTETIVLSEAMRGTDSAALAATALTKLTWTDAKAGQIDAAISSRSSHAAADIWSVLLPGSFTPGMAGYILGTFLDAMISQISDAGLGSETYIYTLLSDADSSAIVGAKVRATSDISGVTTLASGVTDSSGQVTLFLDPGTVYLWRSHSDFSFSNPQTEVIP